MTTDYRSGVSPFTVRGVTFVCWVTDGGQRYEWRSECGRLAVFWDRTALVEEIDAEGHAVARHVRVFAARVEGVRIDREFASLREAMRAATDQARRAAA